VEKILYTEPSFENPAWSGISEEGIKFVKALLTRDPKKRINAKKALAHKWLKKANNVKNDNYQINQNLLKNL